MASACASRSLWEGNNAKRLLEDWFKSFFPSLLSLPHPLFGTTAFWGGCGDYFFVPLRGVHKPKPLSALTFSQENGNGPTESRSPRGGLFRCCWHRAQWQSRRCGVLTCPAASVTLCDLLFWWTDKLCRFYGVRWPAVFESRLLSFPLTFHWGQGPGSQMNVTMWKTNWASGFSLSSRGIGLRK